VPTVSDSNVPQANVSGLLDQIANLKAALKQERGRTKELRDALGVESIADAAAKVRQLSEAAGKVETLQKELEQNQGIDPDEKDELIADLWQQLRGRDHRAAFEKEAAKHGVKSELLDDLYDLGKFEVPDEGDIAPEIFADYFASAKERRAYAFASPEPAASMPGSVGPHGATNTAPAKPIAQPAQPGPGVVRGGADVSRPTTTADAVAAQFEALRGPNAHPGRIA
jgi:hypothetical protein